MRTVELVSGAFLIFIGILVASGQLQNLSQQFAGQFADFSIGIEEDVISFLTGESSLDSDQVVIASTVLEQPQDDRPQVGSTLVGLEVGNIAPGFTSISASGEVISLSGFQGRPVLLNFWATWCGPCRVEMPAFQVQYEKYMDDGFVILAVNNSESASDVMSFKDELGLTFPLVLDEQGGIQEQYGIFSYPSTFILDADGVITYRHFGTLTLDQLEQLLKQHVAGRQ
jgi:peroxiredoxin